MDRFKTLLHMIETGAGGNAWDYHTITDVWYCDTGPKRRQFVVTYDRMTGDAFRIQRVGQRKVVHYA